ncbi:nitrogenase cofactor biosynthesis protein NifB [Telmatospirillum sp.]|uniref:nitrogenase cofactor biosynthesis protein NifB n=1 Tax=Telmatospirillum sp. TaxID=2079197 RepID=UPI00283F9C71|nr:nitrogenase cofactor biosynthesis protein NifB [Telmatospirillum sp.]MDR3436165.1 nitrogenase cofactor biosynthesis protein NifB [Telmatospirillum sp.]
MSGQIISLPRTGKEPAGCASKGQSSCGSSQGPGDMPADIWNKVKDHPCYSEEAHHYFARMHVAVAPACNIQCNYCNRKYDCSNESRPGVVSEKLTPEQALRKVMAVASKVPQLSVLGIAGPGDALANPHRTFRTFELVSKALPHLKLCLSTNGLALPDHVDTIADYNIDHVTITISAVDPEIGQHIYPWIFFDHRRWTGRDAARILHERQMEGLERLVAAGILVKVNSVLIPGLNDQHMIDINRLVKAKGAFLHNVMPLISDPAHGTHFGLTGQRGPTPIELAAVQEDLEGGAKLMRHCRQCRADAVGLLGEDQGADFSLDKIEADPVFDPQVREIYMSVVAQERADRHAAETAARQNAQEGRKPLLVAVATKGGGRINQHFGHAREFQLLEVDGRQVRFIGVRRADNYCKGGYGEEDSLAAIIKALEGVSVVLVARIGDCPRQTLAEAGITVIDDYAHEFIEASALAWWGRVNQAGGRASA